MKLLPITEPAELKKEAGFTFRVTNEGKLQPFLQLELDQAVFAWPELPNHYWGIVGKRKPAATVLATPVLDNSAPNALTPGPSPRGRGEEDSGILVQQNYGF